MAHLLIANGLVVRAELNSAPGDPLRYMGVEFSLPISMAGAAVVAVTGTVKTVVRMSEQCFAEIEGSNDLSRWFPIGSATTLPSSPGPFSIPGVSVGYAWVRVRWVIKAPGSEIDDQTAWTITAELNTNVG